MPTTMPAGVAAFFRPPAEPAAESDAELVSRFVASRDEAAFAALVRRHGPMVLAVCRRQSRQSADAEDTFQAVFLALARDAARIARRESVGGWLYRVAYLLAVKQAGKSARHRPQPFTAEPSAAMPDDHDLSDLKAALDEAVAELSDKLRAVAVACLVEGRTNTDAAKLLGIPVGTVDSRLNAARLKLRDRLARRGVTLAALAGLEVALTADTASAAARVAALTPDLVTHALTYAAGATPAGLEPLSSLADGVTTMTASTVTRRLLIGLLSAALFTGTGVGFYTATAQGPDKPATKADPKAKPPGDAKPAAELRAEDKGEPKEPAEPQTADDVQSALGRNVRIGGNAEMSYSDVIGLLAAEEKLTIRFDTAAFVRRGITVDTLRQLEKDKKIVLPSVGKLPTGDILREALAQMALEGGGPDGGGLLRLSYRIRGNQILVIPEFRPATIPGASVTGDVNPMIPQDQIAENIYGEPVTIRIKNKPFAAVLDELRDMTGANIVVDARVKDKAKETITASFNDARLFTVLKVLGDSCEMRPVVMDNVYYLTSPENAAKLQKEISRDLFGEPPAPQPAIPGGLGGFGGGGTIPPAPAPKM